MKSGSVLKQSALNDPAERSVRLVALSLIDDVQKAGERLSGLATELREGDPAAEDALHDFRVAVRRLRSWTRAFKPWLGDDISKKDRRRLAKLGDASRVSRDASVHLEWLTNERASLTPRQRIGHAWLSEQLTEKRRESAADALAAIGEFTSFAPKLSQRLGFYRAPLRDTDAGGERFGPVIAEQIEGEAQRLRRRLKGVDRFTDVEQAHRARIAAKNLRYLIQPVADLAEGGDAVISTLKKLQQALGDLHDVHIFATELAAATEEAASARARRVSEVVMTDEEGGESENDRIRRARSRDPGPGLLRLARLLHDRGMQAYAEVEREWLNDAAVDFFDSVQQFAKSLASHGARGTEIERKFLLTRLPAVVADASSVEIEQGYLPGEKVIERIRRLRYADGGEKWFRTIKLGNGVTRVELDDEVDATFGRAMWRLTNNRLRKRRYSIREAHDFTWEVDDFLDRNLVLAEIELPTADTTFDIPAWLTEVLDREVTDDPEYSNARLARSAARREVHAGRAANESESPVVTAPA